jgi:hypothetical protein
MLAAGLMVGAFIFGCSTEDPWQPSPSNVLVLSFVSGPSDTVAYGANISFSWTSRGGVGEVVYRYRLGADSWSDWSNVTSVNYQDVTSADTMFVEAQDDADQSDAISQRFSVGAASGADTDVPIVKVVSAPIRDSYVAAGTNVSFTWTGEDAIDGDNLLYWYYWDGMMSADTTSATTVSFEDVQPSDAEFIVWATDQSGNVSRPASDSTWWLDDVPYTVEIEEPDSVHVDTSVYFTIQNANILYVDDYQWLDANDNVDMPKERDQKRFYRNALEGYAIAEWDWAEQGMPDSSDLVVAGEPVYSTIVFASDAFLDDSPGTWWYDIQGPGETSIHYYLESGGNMLVTGSQILPWMWNSIPPAAGDLEFDYFGVDSVESDVISEADSTWWLGDSAYTEPVLLPDSITVEYSYYSAWEQDPYANFTWAIKDANTMLDLPDSMKIDVAKNGDQDDYAVAVLSLRNEPSARTEVLFRWGLNVYAEPPSSPYYLSPVGHITNLNSGQQWTAMLNFDTYSMPLPLIRQTFQAILSAFGE